MEEYKVKKVEGENMSEVDIEKYLDVLYERQLCIQEKIDEEVSKIISSLEGMTGMGTFRGFNRNDDKHTREEIFAETNNRILVIRGYYEEKDECEKLMKKMRNK